MKPKLLLLSGGLNGSISLSLFDFGGLSPDKRKDPPRSPAANKADFDLSFTDDIDFCIKLSSGEVAFLPFTCFCN